MDVEMDQTSDARRDTRGRGPYHTILKRRTGRIFLISTRDRDTHYGLKPDQRRYDFAEAFQWLSWKRDSFENIKSEFLEFESQFSDQLSQEKNAD